METLFAIILFFLVLAIAASLIDMDDVYRQQRRIKAFDTDQEAMKKTIRIAQIIIWIMSCRTIEQLGHIKDFVDGEKDCLVRYECKKRITQRISEIIRSPLHLPRA